MTELRIRLAQATSTMVRTSYKVQGFDCAEEISALRAALEPLPGVGALDFDVISGEMRVDYSPEQLHPDEIIQAVARTGMRAEVSRSANGQSVRKTDSPRRTPRTILTILCGLLLAAGVALHVLIAGWTAAFGTEHSGASLPALAVVLYVASALTGAALVLPKAWLALKALRPDMNLLMVIAIAGAFAIHEYLEAATVSFLFSLSLTLESWSVGRARNAISALLELAPSEARVVHSDGREELVPANQTPVGSKVVVKPGERIPLDGRIIAGDTTIDQSAITGESLPVAKSTGDPVFAGTINHDGAIEFRTDRAADDTALARMTRLIKEAQAKRAPMEQWVERFARYYTPIVLLFAIIMMILPPLILSAGWKTWIYNGLVLLVIACPCALVISTPVSIVSALTAGAQHGVLIKGGSFVELPARLRVVAMDKTGTLTEGKPRVREVVPLSGHSERELLSLACAVEQRSEHPLAQAVVEHAREKGIDPRPASEFRATKGKGAIARVDGAMVWAGSHRMLEERGQETPELHQKLEDLSASGATAIVVGEDEHVCGLIALADQLRANAARVIHDLKGAGVQQVVMLTGDNRGTAEVIGRAAGVDMVYAERLPEDKVAIVENLTAQYKTVAMVGDGVNDAPAMARATVGIAMGAIGSDAAIEAADIALMTDDLSRLPWLIHHSRRTLTIIRQNIITSLLIKAVFMVAAFFGFASLWAAIVADMGVSLAVIANALRLLRDPDTLVTPSAGSAFLRKSELS